MGWEKLERRSKGYHGAQKIRVSRNIDKGRPRTKIRICSEACKALDVSDGDYVDVMFDMQSRSMAFRKGDCLTGFRVAKRHQSGHISFAVPMNKFSKILLAFDDRELGFKVDGETVIVEG